MIDTMNFKEYQMFLQISKRYPKRDHRFVVFEYIESPCDSLIKKSQYFPTMTVSVHKAISHPDFADNMHRLFEASPRTTWYTRRKIDYSKPFEEQLSDSRQLVVIIKRESEDEYDDIPPLIPVNREILNPEDDYYVPSSASPLPTYDYTGSGLNQTIWSPFITSGNYGHFLPPT